MNSEILADFSVRKARSVLPKINNVILLEDALEITNGKPGKDTLWGMIYKRIRDIRRDSTINSTNGTTFPNGEGEEFQLHFTFSGIGKVDVQSSGGPEKMQYILDHVENLVRHMVKTLLFSYTPPEASDPSTEGILEINDFKFIKAVDKLEEEKTELI